MGRKGKWFGAVKRVFSPESKDKKARRLKDKSGFGKSEHSNTSESFEISAPPPPANLTLPEETKLVEAERNQSEQVNPVAIATPPVVRVAAPSELCGKSREEASAIKIQTTFRGYLARRALRALRGLVRLKSLIHGNSVKRQATTTLRCMQTLARVQSQIRSRRIRMSEENQALQRQLLLKRENELENLKMGDEWDDSLQSKEQIEAGMTGKQEAAIRRERALAYAFSHQWKSNSRSVNPLFMDPTNPHWGWSWLERWMAAKPWEAKSMTTTDKDDRTSFNTGAEITDAYARRDTNSNKPQKPPVRHSPSKAKVVKSASPKVGWEDDSRSVISMQSDRNRRHSVGGSSVRDDESLASSSPFVPSYMIPTESAKAKSRFQNIETGSVKKRLSFPVGSPARRHSGPPKMDIPTVTVQL